MEKVEYIRVYRPYDIRGETLKLDKKVALKREIPELDPSIKQLVPADKQYAALRHPDIVDYDPYGSLPKKQSVIEKHRKENPTSPTFEEILGMPHKRARDTIGFLLYLELIKFQNYEWKIYAVSIISVLIDIYSIEELYAFLYDQVELSLEASTILAVLVKKLEKKARDPEGNFVQDCLHQLDIRNIFACKSLQCIPIEELEAILGNALHNKILELFGLQLKDMAGKITGLLLDENSFGVIYDMVVYDNGALKEQVSKKLEILERASCAVFDAINVANADSKPAVGSASSVD